MRVIHDVRRRDPVQFLQRAVGRSVPRAVVTASSQFDQGFALWFVFLGQESLFDSAEDGGKLILGESRSAEDVGIDGNRFDEVVGEGGTGECEKVPADGFASLD